MMLIEPVRSAEGLVDLMHVRVGPAHRAHTGAELEGKLYSETLDAKTFNRMIAVYRTVLETGEPHYWERIDGVYGAPPVEFCRLLLPLYDPQGEAECLLGSWVWKDEELAETNSDAAVALHG